MSVTITLHLWWLGPYLAVGAGLWLPLEWLSWRSIATPKPTFLGGLSERPRRTARAFVAVTVAWPAAIWEQLSQWRYSRRQRRERISWEALADALCECGHLGRLHSGFSTWHPCNAIDCSCGGFDQ